MRRWARGALVFAAAVGLLRAVPGLSALWRAGVSVPALGRLHRLTSRIPFPALELLVPALLVLSLRRRARTIVLTVAVGMYGLLWYPVYFADPVPRRADAGDVEALCLQLTEALNDAPLAFDADLDSAGSVAGAPNARVKAAQYPEWMRMMRISGLFSPWTGEAIIDADAPPGELPFTCVHELMHLKGIADEGRANIAAYRACVDHGGMYADSARLWALRYALGRLDGDARARVLRRADRRLRPLLSIAKPKAPSRVAALLGIGAQTSDYDALVDWLLTGEG